MAQFAIYFCVLVCLCNVHSLNLPSPLVYVVTPSPRERVDEARSAPFYYHNWMRRMDSPSNATSTTTTKPAKVETPDLIFAEFESGSGDSYKKSLRNLLEKEKIKAKTTTTTKPIYVPDEASEEHSIKYNYEPPATAKVEETKKSTPDMTDYFALYNNLYNNDATPVYVASTIASTTASTTTTSTTAVSEFNNVQNIWQVIDSEKENQYGMWEEAPIDSDAEMKTPEHKQPSDVKQKVEQDTNEHVIDDNFALPGFGTNPGNGAENESRAIRTEPNIRFPYVNLKPFQMKNYKKPNQNTYINSKKGNDLFTNSDNFRDTKNPVRGEAQDVMPMRQPIDRYNPAQPYLPSIKYGAKQRVSNQDFPSAPVKSVASLVPPPPPPSAGNDFPAPSSYESFPPYAPVDTYAASAPPPAPAPPSPPKPSAPKYQPQMDTSDDSGPSYDSPPDDGTDDGPPMDMGYRYKPPSPPAQPFVPTLPPLSKPFKGYSYDKPPMTMDTPPVVNKPDFSGYHYNKPEPVGPPSEDHAPSPGYDHHGPPSYDSDYPELIFNKHHGGMGDTKGGDDMKGNDMGMMPPPPPSDMKPDMDQAGPPPDDQGFPHDFPGDFKYHHDFDDHDFYHHHHHHHTTTTTTTTTETPRVNRYSYYYLGKKLYYLPLYFSVYFIVYVGALIIKAVLRHKIVYPNSWRPNDMTQNFFSKRSVNSWNLSNENLHEITGRVTAAIGKAAENYMDKETKED